MVRWCQEHALRLGQNKAKWGKARQMWRQIGRIGGYYPADIALQLWALLEIVVFKSPESIHFLLLFKTPDPFDQRVQSYARSETFEAMYNEHTQKKSKSFQETRPIANMSTPVSTCMTPTYCYEGSVLTITKPPPPSSCSYWIVLMWKMILEQRLGKQKEKARNKPLLPPPSSIHAMWDCGR